MKRATLVALIAALVLATSVAVYFRVDARKQLDHLSSQSDSLSVARAALESVHDTLDARDEQLEVSAGRFDSVSQSYNEALDRIRRLTVESSHLGKQLDSVQGIADGLTARVRAQSDSLAHWDDRMLDSAAALSDTKLKLDSAIARAEQRDRFIAQLQPWYLKWKHDATERNWLEKMIGADKARTPEGSEPIFPPTDAIPPDSANSDALAPTQSFWWGAPHRDPGHPETKRIESYNTGGPS